MLAHRSPRGPRAQRVLHLGTRMRYRPPPRLECLPSELSCAFSRSRGWREGERGLKFAKKSSTGGRPPKNSRLGRHCRLAGAAQPHPAPRAVHGESRLDCFAAGTSGRVGSRLATHRPPLPASEFTRRLSAERRHSGVRPAEQVLQRAKQCPQQLQGARDGWVFGSERSRLGVREVFGATS